MSAVLPTSMPLPLDAAIEAREAPTTTYDHLALRLLASGAFFGALALVVWWAIERITTL